MKWASRDRATFLTAVLALCVLPMFRAEAFAQTVDWPFYGGDQGGMKYSPLDQVNKTNVRELRKVWEWKTGEAALPEFGTQPGAFEATPLVADGTMYVVTPYNRVVALDPVKGTEKWSYDPKAYGPGQPPNGTGFVHRGVALWKDPQTHAYRVLLNTRSHLIELDGATGKLVAGFGDKGTVDLLQGLRWKVDPRQYTNTSPPVVYKNLVIVGNGVGDRLTYRRDPPGDVRAYDVRT